jgi:hypothetical protein
MSQDILTSKTLRYSCPHFAETVDSYRDPLLKQLFDSFPSAVRNALYLRAPHFPKDKVILLTPKYQAALTPTEVRDYFKERAKPFFRFLNFVSSEKYYIDLLEDSTEFVAPLPVLRELLLEYA